MSEETRKILDMLAEGKISVEEAEQLLAAVSKDGAVTGDESRGAPAGFLARQDADHEAQAEVGHGDQQHRAALGHRSALPLRDEVVGPDGYQHGAQYSINAYTGEILQTGVY